MIRNVPELLEALNLPVDERVLRDKKILRDFPVRTTRTFVDAIQKGDWDDPLLRQVLPFAEETVAHPDFVIDPLGEKDANHVPGILHKYHGRVLLVLNGSCAIHCRYCFRRHFPYEAQRERSDAQIDYIKANEDIKEVILSGGDPLLMTDNALFMLINKLEKIHHVSTLRIHSRLPIVLPSRLTDEVCERLNQSRLKIVMVIHCNHANELSTSVRHVLERIKPHVDALLNQSVLLAGVNNNEASLTALSQALFACGVLPYYLHLPDPVAGTTHFHVSEADAVELSDQITKRLPGYLVPRLVKEIAGEPYKTRLL